MTTEAFLGAFRGQTVSHVWRGYGSALFLELGKLRPGRACWDGGIGSPRGEFGVMIEWSWRIEAGGSILCGSWSEAALWPSAFEILVGSVVLDVSLFGRLPEIAIALSGDLHVLSFMTADGHPAWALFDSHAPDCCRSLAFGYGGLRIEEHRREPEIGPN